MYKYISMTYNEAVNFVNSNNKCVISMSRGNIPYAVPMCYQSYCHNNNLYLNLTSKSCGKKMNYMHANEKVCIVIANPNQWRSVIIYGIANIKDECDETANIEICVEKITGRKFYC